MSESLLLEQAAILFGVTVEKLSSLDGPKKRQAMRVAKVAIPLFENDDVAAPFEAMSALRDSILDEPIFPDLTRADVEGWQESWRAYQALQVPPAVPLLAKILAPLQSLVELLDKPPKWLSDLDAKLLKQFDIPPDIVIDYAPPAPKVTALGEWTAEWPTEVGWYWYFGHRNWDDPGALPALYAVQGIIIVEHERVGGAADTPVETVETLRMVSGQKFITKGEMFQRGLWARLSTPAPPKDEFDALPPAKVDPAAPKIHLVYGGAAACGADLAPGERTVRRSEAHRVTCGDCRVQMR